MGKDAVRKLEKMIAKGYIRNIQIDREENCILITAPNRRVNEKIYITVTCPSCGAMNQIIKGLLLVFHLKINILIYITKNISEF